MKLENESWKKVYLMMFYNSRRKQRTNIKFINSLRSQAKLYSAIVIGK